MSATLDLARELIRRRSVTPEDAGCQALMCQRLAAIGFAIEPLPFGAVSNFWARRGSESPLLCFAGHTDVVPSGPEADWSSPPFEPSIRDGRLYGRGAADMKGSLAAMITAVEAFVAEHPQQRGSIAFLITSDEEGPAKDGTARVVERLQARGEKIDWCLVGEPSSSALLGDVIKNGRRGSLNAHLRVDGRQGHVAYPQLADNPIHRAAPALAALAAQQWDAGNEFFPPTSFQISNLNSGTGATNVIPGRLEALFNFRFSTEVAAPQLQAAVEGIFAAQGLDCDIAWRLSGEPFITAPGELTAAAIAAVEASCGLTPKLSTSGGTSDGRFIAPTGAQVIELGPINASIHQLDEHVNIADLDALSAIYQRILANLLG